MKKIVVPTDFSEQAENALSVAVQIAKKTGGEVIILNIIEPMQSYVAAADGMYIDVSVEQKYIEFLYENARKRLEEIVKSNTLDYDKISTRVAIGSVFQQINLVVEEVKADLIVMGTSGATGLEEVLIGSNTEKVVRTATCPVLAIKEKVKDFSVRRILLPTQFDSKQIPVMKEIQKLQDVFGAELYLLFVNSPVEFFTNKEIYQKKEDFMSKVNLSKYQFQIYSELNEEKGIIYFADEINADMIIIATHQRTGLSHLFSGSVAEDLVNHCRRPVLTYGLKHLSN